MRLFFTLLSVSLVPASSNLQAQVTEPTDAVQILSSMNGTVETLQARYRRSKSISTELGQISKKIIELRSRVRQEPNIPQPVRYIKNLAAYAKFLQLLADRPVGNEQMLSALREITSDLDIKVIYSKGSRGQPLREIETIVHTVKDGNKEISGYEVWYVPRGLVDYPDEHKRFDNLSTPAIMPLPPGNYILWAAKGKSVSERRPLTIGDDGRSKRQYYLPVK